MMAWLAECLKVGQLPIVNVALALDERLDMV
jgi:hypothetical protein